MSFSINEFLKEAVEMRASDIHLHIGEYPTIRKEGQIIKSSDKPLLTEEDLTIALNSIMPKFVSTTSHSELDLDFSYELEGVSRFRVNLSYLRGKPALAFRCVPFQVRNFKELNLPNALEQFVHLNNGIVFITGPTGCGKSTTLASLIDYINAIYAKHIVTIEDPIEFVFSNKKSIISQRQVGIDTLTFESGIKYSLRQDPDVILIGEVRDVDTVNAALKAAETGHLVFATLHTNDAVQTVNRVINFYEPDQRTFVRKQLASVLRGTVAQKLVLTKDNNFRYPACEIMVATSTISDFIVKDCLEEVYDLVKKGSYNAMQTLNMSLIEMVNKEYITPEEALSQSNEPNELQQMLKGFYYGAQK